MRCGGRPVAAPELSSARKRPDVRARAPQGRDVLTRDAPGIAKSKSGPRAALVVSDAERVKPLRTSGGSR
ncbi:hypothetical protein EMIT0111MI5_30100 [Burkholderia sp. IT-111MI5]